LPPGRTSAKSAAVSDSNTFIIPVERVSFGEEGGGWCGRALRKLAPKPTRSKRSPTSRSRFVPAVSPSMRSAARLPHGDRRRHVAQWMDADHADDAGFRLRPIAMPCLQALVHAADLAYEDRRASAGSRCAR
jgi:hypothetical protein